MDFASEWRKLVALACSDKKRGYAMAARRYNNCRIAFLVNRNRARRPK
jgi:hypothetical protein